MMGNNKGKTFPKKKKSHRKNNKTLKKQQQQTKCVGKILLLFALRFFTLQFSYLLQNDFAFFFFAAKKFLFSLVNDDDDDYGIFKKIEKQTE